MLVKAALRDEHGDQQSFDDGAEQIPAARSLDGKPDRCRGPDQQYDDNDPAVPARAFAAILAVELAIEKSDRATRDDHRMVDVAEDRRHVTEQRIDDEAGHEQQHWIDADRHHCAVKLRRRSGDPAGCHHHR